MALLTPMSLRIGRYLALFLVALLATSSVARAFSAAEMAPRWVDIGGIAVEICAPDSDRPQPAPDGVMPHGCDHCVVCQSAALPTVEPSSEPVVWMASAAILDPWAEVVAIGRPPSAGLARGPPAL
jgi:hypothetical protein